MEPCCGALIRWLRKQTWLGTPRSLPRPRLLLVISHNHDQASCLAHTVHPLLAHSVAGSGRVAHCLVDFNTAAVDRDWDWCCTGADQGSAVHACAGAGSSRLVNGNVSLLISFSSHFQVEEKCEATLLWLKLCGVHVDHRRGTPGTCSSSIHGERLR